MFDCSSLTGASPPATAEDAGVAGDFGVGDAARAVAGTGALRSASSCDEAENAPKALSSSISFDSSIRTRLRGKKPGEHS